MSETLGHSRCLAEAATVLGEPALSIEPLQHSRRNTVTREVWRVRSERKRAVVKVVSTEALAAGVPGADASAHPYFVAREPMLYQRGLPSAYSAAAIAMPRLLDSVERPGAIALWLEDVQGLSASELTVGNYAEIARRLGRAQGGNIARTRSEGVFPWSRDFLNFFLSSWNDVGWHRINDDDAWTAPLAVEHFSAQLRAELVQLCADRREMLKWATRLPQTICHHDVWPNNVFDSDDQTTLIDWAFAGYGHVGADPGNLVTDSCGDLLQPAALLPELDATVTVGYREGLSDAGWRGDFRFVRLGMCIMAAKWSWLVPHMLQLAAEDHHVVYGGQPVDSNDLFAERAAMLAYYATLAAEARALAFELGM